MLAISSFQYLTSDSVILFTMHSGTPCISAAHQLLMWHVSSSGICINMILRGQLSVDSFTSSSKECLLPAENVAPSALSKWIFSLSGGIPSALKLVSFLQCNIHTFARLSRLGKFCKFAFCFDLAKLTGGLPLIKTDLGQGVFAWFRWALLHGTIMCMSGREGKNNKVLESQFSTLFCGNTWADLTCPDVLGSTHLSLHADQTTAMNYLQTLSDLALNHIHCF